MKWELLGSLIAFLGFLITIYKTITYWIDVSKQAKANEKFKHDFEKLKEEVYRMKDVQNKQSGLIEAIFKMRKD